MQANSFSDTFLTFLKQSEQDGLTRHLSLDHTKGIDFSSNDYLGLSKQPSIILAIEKAVKEYGFGAKGSRLLGGNHVLFHTLEKEIAHWLGKEAVLFFNSGYQLNVGILPALLNSKDVIFADKFIHASLIDGSKLSQAKLYRFAHNDMAHLKQLLEKYRKQYNRALILTEALFSMDGDVAMLTDLVSLKYTYNASLMVDEAHSIACFGEEGRGLCFSAGVLDDIDIFIATFGKAFGGMGAFVAGSSICIDYLVNRCRSFIYTTALPLPVIAGNIESLKYVREANDLRQRLHDSSAYVREKLSHFSILGSSYILPVIVGDNNRLIMYATELLKNGVYLPVIRTPTVPRGSSRFRISLSAKHTVKMLDSLLFHLLKTIQVT